MKHLLVCLFLTTLFFSHKVHAQKNNTEAALYNIGLGSFFGGVGAVINKKPEDKLGKTFLKGFYQGAVGGYLIYESKNIVSKIPDSNTLEYNWAAKLVNSAGVSIIENAALNRDFYEQWNLNIGFNRIEFHTKNKLKIKYKILPVSLLLTSYTAINNKFEFEKSLQTGVFIFSNNLNNNYNGYTIGNAIKIDNAHLQNNQVITHELIHQYQYYDYNVFNTYSNKIQLKWNSKSKILNTLYFDVLGVLTLRGLYLIEKEPRTNTQTYYKNFFEHEAGYYSSDL